MVQWLSSSLGGLSPGGCVSSGPVFTRMRFFRDTAHGFLSWALTTIVGTALFAAASTSIISSGARERHQRQQAAQPKRQRLASPATR